MELDFSDPAAYVDIYSIGSRSIKDPALYDSFGQTEASFGMIDPRASKERRDMLNPLFSRRAILKLEGVIQEKV